MTPPALPPGETPPVRRYGFPAVLWRALDDHPPPGLSRIRWRSPLRGPWLTSVFGATLLVVLPIVIVTGLLSYIAYGPQFGQAIPFDVGWLKLPTFDWPTQPVVAVPLEPGPARRFGPGGDPGGAGQTVVGDSAAVRVATGAVGGPGARAGDAAHAGGRDPLRDRHRSPQHPVRLHLRIQLLHGALFRGVGIYRRICGPCLPEAAENGAQPAVAVDAQRSCAPRWPTRYPNRPTPTGWWQPTPIRPTLSRRGALAVVGGGVLLVGVLTAGQTLGGFTRSAALLLPRGRSYGKGPNDFQINRTAVAAGIDPAFAGGGWRLHLLGGPDQVTAGPRRAGGDARATPWNCRSPASRGGRRRRPGPVSGWPIWPPRPGAPTRARRSCPRWSAFGAFNHAVLQDQPDLEPRLAVGVAGQRCRPLAGSRLSGADHRSRASRGAQHQMGVRHRIPGNLMRALAQLAARLYGERLFHLIVVLAASGAGRLRDLGAGRAKPVQPDRVVAIHCGLVRGGRDRPRPDPVSALRAGRSAAAPVAADGPNRRHNVEALPLRITFGCRPWPQALLLLIFLPGIIEQGAPTYRAATGLTQAPYLSRWLLLTAAFYLASALCYAVRTLLGQHRSGDTTTTAPPATPPPARQT